MTAGQIFGLVAGATFCVAVGLAAPGLTWLDGGEFVVTVATLGVSHPPGQPAYMVLASLAGLLPIGELAFRLSLLSAACAATAAGLLAIVVARGAAWWAGVPGLVGFPGVLAGLVLGLGPALTMQAVRPELYALALALGLAAVAAIQRGGRRGLALAVLPLCVAGAVHHAMLVAAIPGLALYAVGRGRGSLRAGIAASLLLLPLGLLQFAWLPLRSAALPPFDFGAPRTWERIVHAVTAAGYARSFRLSAEQLWRNVGEHGALFVADLGWLVIVAAVGGGVLMMRRAPRLAIAGGAWVIVGAAPTALQGIFSPANPDAHGYLLGPVSVLCAAAGLGIWALVERVRASTRLASGLAAALSLAVVSQPLLATLGAADHRGLASPRIIGAALLDSAPPGALLLLGGDSWLFPPMAARYHERRRADLHVLGLNMLDPSLLADAARRGVPVPEVVLGPHPPGLASEATLLRIMASPPAVPVLINEFFVAPPLLASRSATGLLYRLGGDGIPLDGERAERAVHAAVVNSRGWAADRHGQGVLARRALARGGFFLQRGDAYRALRMLSRGADATTDPWAMVRLARHRVLTGADQPGPWPWDALAEQAARQLMAGEFEASITSVEEVLALAPTHPDALLITERLYSLGRYVRTEVAVP